jgi:uncharacterized protein YraI
VPATPLAATAVAAAAQADLVAIVVGREAALDTVPNGDLVVALPTGTALTATGRTAAGDWVYARTADDSAGWVAVDQIAIFNVQDLAILEPSTPGKTPRADGDPVAPAEGVTARVILTASHLNVRSGPGTDYSIVAKAGPGEVLRVLATNPARTWVQVELPAAPSSTTWVSAEYVELSSPIGDLPVSDRTGSAVVDSVITPSTLATLEPVTGASTSGNLRGNLVIQDATGMIHVYNLESAQLRPLTAGYDPAVSPDGRAVAFTRSGGQNGLYLIGIDGRDERRIFNGREALHAPSWSPDGQWLAFVYHAGSISCRQVGMGICLPDNNRFLDSFPAGSDPVYGLARVDMNGENYRDLPALNTAQAPNWGTSGIVYASPRSIEITADTPGQDGTRLVASKPFYQDPSWQPGGERIVFQSKEGTHWEIFAVNADGSGLVPLTRPSSVLVDAFPHNVAPAWSPDGQTIIFLSNRDTEGAAGSWGVWVMNADGSHQRALSVPVTLDYTFGSEQVISWGL